MTGSPLRRLQEFAVVLDDGLACSRATKEANLAGCLSECNPKPHYDGQPASPTAGVRGCAR